MDDRIHVQKNEILLPADIPVILEKYGNILATYENIPGRDFIYPDFKLTTNLLSALFPLKEHPIHGKTGLHAIEIQRWESNQVFLSVEDHHS